MIPGPSSVLLVTDTVSYPALSFYVTVTEERDGLIDAYRTNAVLCAPLRGDLSAQIRLGRAAAC